MDTLGRCAFSLGVALGVVLAAGAPAPAQDKVNPDTQQQLEQLLKKNNRVPPATSNSPADKAGTHEPSTKGAGPGAAADVFRNGSLAVPGAPTETETAPAKFSARNATSDRLPTAAFRLKTLTYEQKREISRQLTAHSSGLALSPGGQEPTAKIGAELPIDVALSGLPAVPEAVAARFPILRDTAFMRTDAAVLIVDIRNRQVIGVLSAP
jgi:hypothetical protein